MTLRRVGAKDRRLAAQAQTCDNCRIALWRSALQIVKELAALVDHLEQATARSVVTLVGGEMPTELIDTCAQQRDLHFRRSGIVGVAAILLDDSALLLCRQ